MTASRDLRWLFVCRGSAEDGLGHVIRTRALVERLPAGTAASVVVVGDSLVEALLEGLDVPWTLVTADTGILDHLHALEPDVVVFDSIPLDRAVFNACRSRGFTVSISPIFDHLDDVELAFNRTRYLADGTTAIASNQRYGPEYAIVRPECVVISSDAYARQLNEETLSVAVSMGGADAPNRTLRILDALHGLDAPATFWVLLGEGYGHSYEELVDAVRRDRRHEVILAKTNRSMWRILRNCSVAVLAGGVTTYEAAYAGLPSINVIDREEQRFLIRELVDEGAAVVGGVLDHGGVDELRTTIQQLERERDRLLEMHLNSQRLVDGLGAQRVLSEITRLVRRSRAGALEIA